ncbi:MAG: hypothetical protein GY944_15575, partial [bacterium]|nr:hypothetical protein [bacterium]
AALVLRILEAGYGASPDSEHARSLLDVVESMQRGSANAFLHDELGEIHDPCYFTQFVSWASEWGLEYLSEVDLGAMSLEGLPDRAQGMLQQLAPDFIETQQLIDFLVNRSGRTSLLVADDAPIARKFSADTLETLRFSTSLRDAVARRRGEVSKRSFADTHDQIHEFEDSSAHALVCAMVDSGEATSSLADLSASLNAQGIPSSQVTPALLSLLTRGHATPNFDPYSSTNVLSASPDKTFLSTLPVALRGSGSSRNSK